MNIIHRCRNKSGNKPGPRRFRYTIEIILPPAVNEEDWHSKFAQGMMDAMHKLGGTVFLAVDENEIIKVREIRDAREG